MKVTCKIVLHLSMHFPWIILICWLCSSSNSTTPASLVTKIIRSTSILFPSSKSVFQCYFSCASSELLFQVSESDIQSSAVLPLNFFSPLFCSVFQSAVIFLSVQSFFLLQLKFAGFTGRDTPATIYNWKCGLNFLTWKRSPSSSCSN